MGFVPNSQQQQLFQYLFQTQLADPFLYQQAKIFFQHQLANLSTVAAAPPAQKTPITKPSSSPRAFSSRNSIISASAPVRKLRDSLYQGMFLLVSLLILFICVLLCV